jgi:hypothetical protein
MMSDFSRFRMLGGAAPCPDDLMDVVKIRPVEADAAALKTSGQKPRSATAYSIFHEPWWLDVTMPGQWQVVRSVALDRVVGEMPFCISRKGVWTVSSLPPLTRTLGPVVEPVGKKRSDSFRHRLNVTYDLIDQLPDVDLFHQIFDPRQVEAMAFLIRGYTVSQSYTFQIPSGCPLDDAWGAIRLKTRNLIRTAAGQLEVKTILSAREFVSFYAARLAERAMQNRYDDRMVQRLLDTALARGAGRILGAYSERGQLVAAIAVIWDSHAMYYLLSSRKQSAHNGSISLLLWTAIQDALARGLCFDFDGIASASILSFLSGFGGDLVPRIAVERTKPGYRAAREIRNTSGRVVRSLAKLVGKAHT